MAGSRHVEEHRHQPPLLVEQDLVLTLVETPRG